MNTNIGIFSLSYNSSDIEERVRTVLTPLAFEIIQVFEIATLEKTSIVAKHRIGYNKPTIPCIMKDLFRKYCLGNNKLKSCIYESPHHTYHFVIEDFHFIVVKCKINGEPLKQFKTEVSRIEKSKYKLCLGYSLDEKGKLNDVHITFMDDAVGFTFKLNELVNNEKTLKPKLATLSKKLKHNDKMTK